MTPLSVCETSRVKYLCNCFLFLTLSEQILCLSFYFTFINWFRLAPVTAHFLSIYSRYEKLLPIMKYKIELVIHIIIIIITITMIIIITVIIIIIICIICFQNE